MVICDARRRIRKLWGGYSPKVYDGDFLKLNADWFREKTPDDVFIADNHFSWGRDESTFPKTFANNPEPAAAPPDGSDTEVLTHKRRRNNAAVAHARARVETPFGIVKNKWKSLGKPFGESGEQLDCLVWLGFAVHNAMF